MYVCIEILRNYCISVLVGDSKSLCCRSVQLRVCVSSVMCVVSLPAAGKVKGYATASTEVFQ